MKRDGAKRRKSEAFKCKQCEHGPFALVCMVMHFFLCLFLYIYTAFKLPHHPPLSITHHLPSPPLSPPPSTRPPPLLSPSSMQPPTPPSTQRCDHHHHQPQQVNRLTITATVTAPGMSFFHLLPLLLMILLQSVTFTIHNSPFTITTPHHKSNIENALKTCPPPQRHVWMLQEQQLQQLGGLRRDTSQGPGAFFFFFFYILLTTLFCVNFVYTHHLASNGSSGLETWGMFINFKN